MSDNNEAKKKKPMTASDYVKTQPSMQGKNLLPSTQNKYSALAEYPPLSYSKAVAPERDSQQPGQQPLPAQKSTYYTKPHYQHLITTPYTKPVTLKELNIFTNRLFYETSLWVTDNVTKDRTFYEFILVDTKTIEVTHYPDKNNPSLISYSTCKILRICSTQDLGFIHHHTLKPFSTPGYHFPGFTYMDYRNALFNTFYLRPYDHSWFFSFDINCPKQIPGWFYEWWYWFGPTDQIYPSFITKTALPYYSKHISEPSNTHMTEISFHIDMGVPWISSWNFSIIQALPKMTYSLVREFRVKWWDKYNQDRCSLLNQEKWLQTNKYLAQAVKTVSRSIPVARAKQHGLQHPNPPRQTTQRSPLQSASSSTTSSKKRTNKEKLKKIIQELMSSSDEDEDITQSPPDSDPFGGPLGQDPYGKKKVLNNVCIYFISTFNHCLYIRMSAYALVLNNVYSPFVYTNVGIRTTTQKTHIKLSTPLSTNQDTTTQKQKRHHSRQ